MKKGISVIILYVFVAGCAGTVATRTTTTLGTACNTLASLVKHASTMRDAGQLSTSQRDLVSETVLATDPICKEGSTFNPQDGIRAVEKAIETLNDKGIKQ